VGTQKRERQKANRTLKHQQLARQERNDSIKRRGVRIAAGVALALAGILALAWFGGAFDDDDEGTITQATDPFATSDTTDTDATAQTTGTESSPTTAAGATETTGLGTGAATTVPAAGPTECPAADGSSPVRQAFDSAPPMCIDEAATYTALVETNHGEFTVELDAAQAPITVNNFVVLARYHYFDGTPCHRIIPSFVVQCGDPTGTGTGDPGYEFEDELPDAGAYEVGSLAMANSGPNTNGSQFFVITGEDGAALPPNYSLFGQVTDGLDSTIATLDSLGNGDPAANGVPPIEDVVIERVTITEA
jgi:cyclophilin family peptidyl-prolyl cis-trans isomerase